MLCGDADNPFPQHCEDDVFAMTTLTQVLDDEGFLGIVVRALICRDRGFADRQRKQQYGRNSAF